MFRLQRPAYICQSCLKKINRSSIDSNRSTRRQNAPSGVIRGRSFNSVARCDGPASTTNQTKRLRLAIIGSGPAGFYTAYRVMHKLQDAVIDMYERLPAPFGLVRYGVAPDHPEVKNCEEKFDEVASNPHFNFIGNIAIGTDIPLTSLRVHYDAILFAYGASEDKQLGIPGENLKGIYSARAFVGWYNGLPEYSNLNPILDRGDNAVIIGQGNVALDVARILLTDVDTIRHTDIANHALDVLSKSRIRYVDVVGRRGPMQAAFTLKEVRELMNLPFVGFEPIDSALLPADMSKLPRTPKRRVQLLAKSSSTSSVGLSTVNKKWALKSLLSPVSFEGDPRDPKFIGSVRFKRTEFRDSDPFASNAQVRSTESEDVLSASVAFRSVGYKSEPIPGLEEIGVTFDRDLGIIPNDIHGRVMNPNIGPGSKTAGHVPGLYCAGWVKRGPTGVIASTMEDAFTTADVIARDWEDCVPFLNSQEDGISKSGWDGLRGMADEARLRPITWHDWKRIDNLEKERGKTAGKEREKLTSVTEMLQALDP